MSARFLVFVGSADRRAQLEASAAADQWHVYEALENPVMGALAQVISLLPDAVVLEDTDDNASREVYMHLASMGFTPIIVLTDAAADWQHSPDSGVTILPRAARAEDILAALATLVDERSPTWA